MIGFLGALMRRIAAVACRNRQAEGRIVDARDAATDAYTDSDPILATPDEEQAEALERVRRIYHQGTQPLTVAKARYDLLRRGDRDAPDR